MNNICIIPARAGSKRISDKNIKPFLGKPIVAYSIEAARQSEIFDDVIVFTNSGRIARIAAEYGAGVLNRSRSNATADAILYQAVVEALASFPGDVKYCCVLYPCAPFVTPEVLRKGLTKLTMGYDAVYPIVKNSFHFEQLLWLDRDRVKMMYPEFNNLNTRDEWLTTYHHASQWFWCDVEKLFENETLIPENSGAVILPWWAAQDIDEPEDWTIAEKKYAMFLQLERK